jgi:hypothetical protein
VCSGDVLEPWRSSLQAVAVFVRDHEMVETLQQKALHQPLTQRGKHSSLAMFGVLLFLLLLLLLLLLPPILVSVSLPPSPLPLPSSSSSICFGLYFFVFCAVQLWNYRAVAPKCHSCPLLRIQTQRMPLTSSLHPLPFHLQKVTTSAHRLLLGHHLLLGQHLRLSPTGTMASTPCACAAA